MNKKTLKAVLIVSLMFNLAVVATVAVGLILSESETSRAGTMPIDDHGKHLSKCIGLTGKQAKCFEDVMADASEEAKEIKADLTRERDVLFHLLQADKADREAIAASVDRISVLQGKLEMLLVMRVVDSREVLSPEEDERLLYLIRCSMKPGCVGKENCPAQKKRKEESE